MMVKLLWDEVEGGKMKTGWQIITKRFVCNMPVTACQNEVHVHVCTLVERLIEDEFTIILYKSSIMQFVTCTVCVCVCVCVCTSIDYIFPTPGLETQPINTVSRGQSA